MNYNDLKEEDKLLIKNCMEYYAVDLIKDALLLKNKMSRENFNSNMKDAKRINYLMKVLENKEEYDK